MRFIELRVAKAIDRVDAWRMLVPVTAIACIEQWKTMDRSDQDVARVTLMNGSILWATETYSALVDRLRAGVDESFLAPTDES
jgi:hypothetical protein